MFTHSLTQLINVSTRMHTVERDLTGCPTYLVKVPDYTLFEYGGAMCINFDGEEFGRIFVDEILQGLLTGPEFDFLLLHEQGHAVYDFDEEEADNYASEITGISVSEFRNSYQLASIEYVRLFTQAVNSNSCSASQEVVIVDSKDLYEYLDIGSGDMELQEMFGLPSVEVALSMGYTLEEITGALER